MDEALIKPQHVRRVVKIQQLSQPSPGGSIAGEPDVTAQGTLVEVSDPRTLRPRDFRTDFVYTSGSSPEDVALCDLPPLLESVLGGTDALLLVAGAEGAGQADLVDGGSGVNTTATCQLISELQARQARHRQGGSGGYSFQMKINCLQVSGDRIDDLLTNQPEPTRLVDRPEGLAVEGIRSVAISSAEEASRTLETAQRRRDPAQRARTAGVLIISITQADYFAGWGLFGRFLLVEAPALDCLAEDRGLVQLREGFDTFRGVYHLRNIVHAWQPQQSRDVNGSALTWLLRDSLCGGSVSATVLMCLKQGQPTVSRSLLEFLDDFGKIQTNPVCCDHRVAGLSRAMRGESILARQAITNGNVTAGGDADEDARRIILELERRLRAAERNRDDAVREQDMKQGRAVDFQDRYLGAIQGQESMHERLVTCEEERLRACQGGVEAQLEATEVRDEMSEMQYKDNILLLILEQEVADLQTAGRQRQELNEHLEQLLFAETSEHSDAAAGLQALRGVVDGRELAAAHSEEAAQDHSSRLQAEIQCVRDLQLKIDTLSENRMQMEIRNEIDRGQWENQIEVLRMEMQRGALDATSVGVAERERGVAELREAQSRAEEPQRDLQGLRRTVSELREQLQLESAAAGQARGAGEEAETSLARERDNFQRALQRLAASSPTLDRAEDGSTLAVEGDNSRSARAQLADLDVASSAREQRLLEEQRRLQAHVRELQSRLVWASHIALDWAPTQGAESDQAKLRNLVNDAEVQSISAAQSSATREKDSAVQNVTLRAESERDQQQIAVLKAEHARELRRREVEQKRAEAEILELRGVAGSMSADRAPVGSIEQIQQHLLAEIEALKVGGGTRGVGAGNSDLAEKNRALQSRVDQLERHGPKGDRAQAQRLAFLEKATRTLEAERSELFVRSTVAEEQLTQLQRHLKEMTESYQMQILKLKMQVKSQ